MDFDELHFWSTLNLNFAGYTSSKDQVRNRLKMEFVEIHFSKSIFQKSSADQQETFRIMMKCTGILVTLRKQGMWEKKEIVTVYYAFCLKKWIKKVNIKQRKKYHKT